jgi:hypothetical protein
MWTAVTADPMLRPEDEVGVQRQVTVPTGANIPVLSHEPGILVAMHAHSGRRYRAYPTPGQAERLTGWGHSCRAVWNLALEQRRFAWRQRARTLRSAEQCRHLTDARADLPWLADLPAQSAQQVLRQLDRAYDNWWNPEHPAQAPTFRKRSGLSIPFPGQAVQVRKCSRRWAEVRLPKLGWVRFRLSRPLGGTVRNAAISKDALGWRISFGVATATKPAPPNRLPGCGVDFGVACSAFVSDEREPRLMPWTLTPGQRRRLLGLERRKARQAIWAKETQRWPLLQPAAPHHQPDRRASSAASTPPAGLHPQAHHRPRQEPRLGRGRGPAGEGHDQVGQGHYGGTRQERQGQGGAEPGHPQSRPVRTATPARVQGIQIWIGAASRLASAHKPDVLGLWAP